MAPHPAEPNGSAALTDHEPLIRLPMNTSSAFPISRAAPVSPISGNLAALRPLAEAAGLLAVLLLVNLGLWHGEPNAALAFRTGAMAEGHWWVPLTYPLVHVSLYHLVLDAGAFLYLWHALGHLPCRRRWGLTLSASLGALLFARIGVPDIHVLGLCGLSGPAHGLLAAVALERIWSPRTDGSWPRRVGAISLAILAAKVICEAWTGDAFLGWLHPGDVGVPVAICHAGGVVGAAAAWVIWTWADHATDRYRRSGISRASRHPSYDTKAREAGIR